MRVTKSKPARLDRDYSGPERRVTKRLVVNFLVTYELLQPLGLRMQLKNREVDGRMFDLSEEGVGLLTVYRIPPLTLLRMRFVFINPHAYKSRERVRAMQMEGEVRYNILYEKEEHRMGVRFIDLKDEDRLALADFVKWQSIYNTIAPPSIPAQADKP